MRSDIDVPAPAGLDARVRSAGAPDRQRGYSLIEVLAAAAILSFILIAILTMFVYGGQSVNAGKMMTRATSISSDVLETFRSGQLSFRQAHLLLSDDATRSHNTWNSDTGGPQAPTDATFLAMLARWKQYVEGDPTDHDPIGLPKGKMTITVRGISDLGATPPEISFNNARLLQVVVTVKWTERKRQRSVVFETIRG
jgi:prepilin-type N-terminal cleavage/methylation domain-containing protein